MKKNKYIVQLALCLSLGFAAVSCQDEVLVKTEDTTTVDALLAEIDVLDNQYVTLNEQNYSLSISNSKLSRALDSLNEIRQNLDNPYSQPVTVDLTVNVMSAAKTVFTNPTGRTAGLEGATVVVEQNELVLQPTSSAAGIYLFRGLRDGQARIKVSAPNHTSVEARIYLYISDGEDAAGAQTFNANTPIVLYPIAGELAATMKGMMYANTSTLNDSLNRKYGSVVAFGTKANTTIAAAGNYTFTNNTTNTTSRRNYNLYNVSPSGSSVAFEVAPVPTGYKVFAYPTLVNQYINNDGSANGYLTELIYKGIITSTTVAADGTFTLPILASSTYSDFSLISGISIVAEPFVANHKRFTTGANYAGQDNESGSASESFSYYNNTDFTQTPFTGTGTNVAAPPLDPAKKLTVTRRTITESWQYNAYFTDSEDESDGTIDNLPESGHTVIRNIYFFPRVKQ